MNYTKIRPLLNRVLVKKVQLPTKTVGGILLPDKTHAQQKVGMVADVGEGRFNSTGVFVKTSVKPGDYVLLPDYGGNMVPKKPNTDEELFIYAEEELLGIVNEKI